MTAALSPVSYSSQQASEAASAGLLVKVRSSRPFRGAPLQQLDFGCASNALKANAQSSVRYAGGYRWRPAHGGDGKHNKFGWHFAQRAVDGLSLVGSGGDASLVRRRLPAVVLALKTTIRPLLFRPPNKANMSVWGNNLSSCPTLSAVTACSRSKVDLGVASSSRLSGQTVLRSARQAIRAVRLERQARQPGGRVAVSRSRMAASRCSWLSPWSRAVMSLGG